MQLAREWPPGAQCYRRPRVLLWIYRVYVDPLVDVAVPVVVVRAVGLVVGVVLGISTIPQSSLVAVWRKRAVVPENVSIVGAGVMVPQVSSPMGMGAALMMESGGNVTRPVLSTVPVTVSRALVSSKIAIAPVIVSCAWPRRLAGDRAEPADPLGLMRTQWSHHAEVVEASRRREKRGEQGRG